MRTATIAYTQEGVLFDDEVSINLSIHDGNSNIIVLIIPGIDGSVDGYQNKYLTMAENINRERGATAQLYDYIDKILLRSVLRFF